MRAIKIVKGNSFFRLAHPHESSKGKGFDGINIQFRMRNSTPVPFIEMDFTDKGQLNPVKEVIIGPKNDVSEGKLSVFLETVGLSDVVVKRSTASYR